MNKRLLRPIKKIPFRNDKFFIEALRKFIDQANFLESKDEVLSEINNSINIFGNLGLKQKIVEVNNGSVSSLNRNTGTYLRTTYLPESGVEIKDIIKVLKNSEQVKKIKQIENIVSGLINDGILDDIGVTHSYSEGNVIGYLFTGEDLKVFSQKLDKQEKKELTYRLFQVHLDFARTLTSEKKRFKGCIFEDDTHLNQFEKSFIKRFGYSGNKLEDLINKYKKDIVIDLDNIKSKYVQHADPKFSNAIIGNAKNIKLIDFEYISESPIHKLVYWFWDRYNVSLKNIFSILHDNNFFQSDYNLESFKSDFDKMRNHEDLLNCARCFELSLKTKTKIDKYTKYANFYLNRALENLKNSKLKKEISDFVTKMSDGKIKQMDREEFDNLKNDFLIKNRELSTHLVVDFETYSQKIEAIEKKQRRGRFFRKTLLLAGSLISLGLIGVITYGTFKYNERQFVNETYRLNAEWARSNNSLLIKFPNPCDILENEGKGTFSDNLIIAKEYEGSYLVERLIRKYGIENEKKIIKNLPKLLQQQIFIYNMAKNSSDGKAHLDDVLFTRKDQIHLPFFTHQEFIILHTEFPCLRKN